MWPFLIRELLSGLPFRRKNGLGGQRARSIHAFGFGGSFFSLTLLLLCKLRNLCDRGAVLGDGRSFGMWRSQMLSAAFHPDFLSERTISYGRTSNAVTVAFASYFLLICLRQVSAVPYPHGGWEREQPIALDRSRESPGVVESAGLFGICYGDCVNFPHAGPEKSIRRENP